MLKKLTHQANAKMQLLVKALMKAVVKEKAKTEQQI